MESVADGEWIGDKNEDSILLTNSFDKLDMQDGKEIGSKQVKNEAGGENKRCDFLDDEQDDHGDGLILLDDNGQKLCSLEEPTEFDKVVAAIEDTMIDEDLGNLQLECVIEYHRLTTSSDSSDIEAKKKEIFEDYKAKMCAALEVGVKRVCEDFDMLEFLDEIFAKPRGKPQTHSKEFEESEIYELLQTMHNFEGFGNLVADYVDLVDGKDVLSAVKVIPFQEEEKEHGS